MTVRYSIVATVLLLGFVQSARAWDDFGHMQIAAVAYDQLTDLAKARVAQLLRLNPSYPHWIVGAKRSEVNRAAFVRASTWADAIKGDSRYKKDEVTSPTSTQNIGYADFLKHDYWHYIDLPFSPDGTATTPPPVPNAQTQIAAFRQVLREKGPSDDVKSYDLVWLLHLIGDIHQPLHCVSRFDKQHRGPDGDRGGNLVKITGNRPAPVCNDSRYCPYGPPENLHAFVDTITGDSYTLADVYAAAQSLPRAKKQDVAIGDEAIWIQESFELAKSQIYVDPIGIGGGPFTIDEKYQRAVLVLGRKRISLAGQRLARLLNEAFATEANARGSARALHD
jgi:S1/P1 Nuclease